MTKLLIVDDNTELCDALANALIKRNYTVDKAINGIHALKQIESNFYNLILTDIRMPEMDGIHLLKSIKTISPASIVIIMTAYGTVANAVEAMHIGAFDYVLKPFSPKEIEIKLQHALEKQKLLFENKLLKESIQTHYGQLIGSSHSMRHIYTLIDNATQSSDTVLITGESGTGKELVAREIHRRSNRCNEAFTSINCIALSTLAFESDLFGYEKNAFPEAIERKIGRLEASNGGTLFLDGISDISESSLKKLIYLIQEHAFYRLGSHQKNTVNVRIIAANQRNIHDHDQKDAINKSLYTHLFTHTIDLPNLNERQEDIFELTHYFIEKYNAQYNRHIKISPEAMSLLNNYSWPGNVRELENIISQALLTAENKLITPYYLPQHIAKHAKVDIQEPERGTWELSARMNAMEAEIIKSALNKNNGNQSQAARDLGIKRSSLQYKIQKHGLLDNEK